jgi:hypothetical protein
MYALFQPWQTGGASVSALGPHPQCGPQEPPFVVRSCLDLVRERCPITGDGYDAQRACYNCTRALRRTDMPAYLAANCSSQQTNLLWCRQHGRQQGRVRGNRPPFQKPAAMLAPCLSPNGTWMPEQEVNGSRCSFVSVNGQAWVAMGRRVINTCQPPSARAQSHL